MTQIGIGPGSAPHVGAQENIQVLKKALDQQKRDGQAAIGLIETAAQVGKTRPRSPVGQPGHRLDVSA